MSKTSRLLKVILAVIIAAILVISANFCLFNADRCVLASEGASQRIEFTTPQGPSSASYTNYLNSMAGMWTVLR